MSVPIVAVSPLATVTRVAAAEKDGKKARKLKASGKVI